MKKIGTRAEVYNGLAFKTSGGMTKENIIKIKEKPKKRSYKSKKNKKKINGKDINVNVNVSGNDGLTRENTKEKIKKQKKYLSRKISDRMRQKSNFHQKKISFNTNLNQEKEYICQSLDNDDNFDNDYDKDKDNSHKNKGKFIIEQFPDLSDNDIFN
jgi:hypothetical protein